MWPNIWNIKPTQKTRILQECIRMCMQQSVFYADVSVAAVLYGIYTYKAAPGWDKM